MNNKVLALKYRPKFFDEVIGQDFCVKSLSNSIKLNKIHNAYLFSGTRGVGKTTIARIFAKSLLCKEGINDTPCGKCESCLGIDSNNNLDLIEIDAASRTKVEDTRTLMENVQYAPTALRFKIYLIDEVHMLSTKSFNALLKTIEEPPEHVKFLLATTEPDKLPETVISRCLHFKLNSVTSNSLSEHLEHTMKRENISFEPEVPLIIADAAKGSVRDSMSILEQCISYENGNLTNKKISQLLGVIDEKLIDDIIASLHTNSIKKIQTVLDKTEVNNYPKLLDCLIERIFQISLTRSTNCENNLPEIFLRDTIKLQDLQLWYSILMKAKEDFDNASSKADHLLMILLRITLFTEYPPNVLEHTSSNNKTKEDDLEKKNSNNIERHDKIDDSLDSWASFVRAQSLQGLMLDLAHNSVIQENNDSIKYIIDSSKQGTYPKKCIEDFISLLSIHYNLNIELNPDYQEDIYTLYRKSIDENIKSKKDMYESIKDNIDVKEIEDIFDAKIDKENISKLYNGE